MTRAQLTYVEWEFIEPHLSIGEYGPYPKTLWQQFEGRRKLRLKTALSGRSRGGQISKVHLAADRRCRPLAFVLTAGQAADSP